MEITLSLSSLLNALRAQPAPASRAHRLQRIGVVRWLVRVGVLAVAFVAAFSASHAYAQDAVHVVAGGEKLAVIARSYGVSLDELINYNDITDPNFIFSGQRLLIPGQQSGALSQYGTPAESDTLPAGNGYYTVRRGDTLSEIAKRNGLSTGDLLRLNGLSNANFVWVGQQLRLSARVEPTGIATDETETSDLAGEIYIVMPGDTLSEIAQRFGVSAQDLLAANGLPNANFVWVGQRLRIKGGAAAAAAAVQVAPANGRRWIEVDLTNQTLTAWQGDVAIMYTSISSGLPGTPTVTGRFQVGIIYQSQRMTGPGYDLPGVPWVMYFYGSYALHGAYWHNNFGTPMSHGCVNIRVDESEMLYNWAPIGTEVYVHY